MARALNRAEVRSHPPKAHSEVGLAGVIRETALLWRKHGLGYDQTKYVVEHVRRDLDLAAPRGRRRSVDRLDRFEVERLIQAAYRSRSRHGLMIKTLFLTGARVSEFVQVRVEDLHLDSDPPQIHLVHAKGGTTRYVPILPSLAQELRTHLQARRRGYRRLPPAIQRRNVLAALVAVGCNIGPTRMAAASGVSVWEISEAADWYLLPDALKAAGVDLVNYAIHLPTSQLYGLGDTCSADGMRFYVPVDILAADFSHLLHGRGVTLYAHTAENTMRLHQEPIPCRLREATFVLDGLMMEHETELDPRTVYTDTHGYTEVVMATAGLLGKSLAPRIARMHEQTLYKLDRSRRYGHLDPILDGTIKPHLVRRAWDETVRVVASIQARRR